MHASEVASSNLKAGLDFIRSMAEKALAVAMAPETGGASLLGGLVDNEESGGSSVLGGVLNAKESEGKRDLLSRLTGDAHGGRHLPVFPKVPDHEPGLEFPEVPDHEPGLEFPEVPDHEPGLEFPEVPDHEPGLDFPEIPDSELEDTEPDE
jgi:hypothetical protein